MVLLLHLISSLNHPPHPNSMTILDSSTTAAPTFRTILRDIHFIELFFALVVFITIHSLRQQKRHGLPVWPFLGMLPSLISSVLTETLYELITSVLCRLNGTFLFKGPSLSSLNSVITSDPRNLEYLLKTNFSNFPKGPYFRDQLRDLLGDGIFNADDVTWQKQRKAASLEFHSSRFRNLTYSSLFELVHARLLPVLEATSKRNVSIDLQDVLLRLTFDNVCMLAFGTDPGCLSPGLPEVEFAKAFEDATEASAMRFLMPTCVWKAMKWMDVGSERVLRRSIKGVDKFAVEVIRARKKELALLDGDDKRRSDLLTVFMGMRDEEGAAYTDKFLKDICVNFILAGRDTSSVALSWFFWLVDEHPDVEERIVEEIQGIVKERRPEMDGEQEQNQQVILMPEEIKRMDYLQAALSEALRLYPSVPVDHKQVVEDDIFPDGTVLKKGTKVIYSIYSMGRMESIWGKHCREFKPERWLKDGRFTSESAYKFTAFNGGSRLCLGKDFAYYQMKFVAASILYRYKVKVVKDHPIIPKLALTMYIKHGLKVNLYRRGENDDETSDDQVDNSEKKMNSC
ncbi:Cytochrome P450 86B1 [Linum perenne]